MKRTLALTALFLFLSVVSAPASQPAHSGDSKPQIIADPKTNTVRILIDGKEIVRIDAAGLHVTGDLTYTGAEIDAGGAASATTPPGSPE